MKDYYLDCGTCGIISGKLHGFSLAKHKQKHHELLHKLKNDGLSYIFINDWIAN